MNYYMDLIGDMNARREPDATKNNVIEKLPAGTRVEGDVLVKAADGRDWLSILLIDGRQVAEPAFIATYTTSGKLETYPPTTPTTLPNIRVDVTLYDDFTGLVETKINDVVVSTWTGRLKPPVG